MGRQTFRTGRVVRLGREGGAAVLVVDAFPAVVTCVFGEPDPRPDALKPGDRVQVGGRFADPNELAPRLEGCRLLAGPADFDAPTEGVPAAFWQRDGLWWWPVPAPGPR